ncbi:MAG: transporter substrate-binding domain-containing protein [Desulfobacterales bacterium]
MLLCVFCCNKGTTSQEFMEKQRLYIYTFENVENACAALLAEKVDAVVYDALNLLYYTSGEGKGKVTVVGKIFAAQDYAMALPQGSRWREKVNRAILALLESGDARRIQAKWFGGPAS